MHLVERRPSRSPRNAGTEGFRLVQRVRRATVSVNDREVARIGQGLLALVGLAAQEEPTSGPKLAQRLVKLRIFDDEAGRLNRSIQEVQGELLLIPQVTLTARLGHGTRPSFHTAAAPEAAKALFEAFVREVQAVYPKVSTGLFQAKMLVTLENDGPVTFVLDEP